MNDRTKGLLLDGLQAARSIHGWCNARSFSDYEADRQLRRAVEREFEIIGEALNRLRESEPSIAAQVPELARIVGFRNRIIHGYDTIDEATVWGVVVGHLPALILKLQDLLADVEDGPPKVP